MNIHQAINEIRAVVARAGEQDRLNWWPSTLYTSGDMFMKRLFPKTHEAAAYLALRETIRLKEGTADPRSALLSLFYLGGRREALIAQESSNALPELFSSEPGSGEDLARLLLDTYRPVLGDGHWERTNIQTLNEARGRIDVGSVADSHLDESSLKMVVGSLLTGLRYSTKGRYVPPVFRLDGVEA